MARGRSSSCRRGGWRSGCFQAAGGFRREQQSASGDPSLLVPLPVSRRGWRVACDAAHSGSTESRFAASGHAVSGGRCSTLSSSRLRSACCAGTDVRRQRSMSSSAQYDLVIVGAGIAGCAAAALYGRRGARWRWSSVTQIPGRTRQAATSWERPAGSPSATSPAGRCRRARASASRARST